MQWKINTGNPHKLAEFRTLFANYGADLVPSHIDLREIDAFPVDVIAHKASQVEELTLVEDTILEIKDADVGINVRWLLSHLDNYIGKKAAWTTFLAYREGDSIKIYRGCVHGAIVPPQGEKGFGFDKHFLPVGATVTLAQAKPDDVNARALAVSSLMKGELWQTVKPIYHWQGPWQTEDLG